MCASSAEGDEGEDGVAELGVLVLVDAPEAFGVEGAGEGLVGDALGGVVAVAEDPAKVVASRPYSAATTASRMHRSRRRSWEVRAALPGCSVKASNSRGARGGDQFS
jgi:hypothetical protein